MVGDFLRGHGCNLCLSLTRWPLPGQHHFQGRYSVEHLLDYLNKSPLNRLSDKSRLCVKSHAHGQRSDDKFSSKHYALHNHLQASRNQVQGRKHDHPRQPSHNPRRPSAKVTHRPPRVQLQTPNKRSHNQGRPPNNAQRPSNGQRPEQPQGRLLDSNRNPFQHARSWPSQLGLPLAKNARELTTQPKYRRGSEGGSSTVAISAYEPRRR